MLVLSGASLLYGKLGRCARAELQSATLLPSWVCCGKLSSAHGSSHVHPPEGSGKGELNESTSHMLPQEWQSIAPMAPAEGKVEMVKSSRDGARRFGRHRQRDAALGHPWRSREASWDRTCPTTSRSTPGFGSACAVQRAVMMFKFCLKWTQCSWPVKWHISSLGHADLTTLSPSTRSVVISARS